MPSFLLINKPQGLTPFQAITHLKKTHPELMGETIGYAGRLDPMADGLLMLLLGEENTKRKSYENLGKTYETDVLLGVSTDTYDLLGKVQETNNDASSVIPKTMLSEQTIRAVATSFVGAQKQPYPPFSSQPVNGKPLFYWARENKVDEITIPTKDIVIHTLEISSLYTIPALQLHDQIKSKIAKVQGNFRQEEILSLWNTFFEKSSIEEFQVARLRVSCSSGTYIRSLAHNLGIKLGTGALALSITRTAIGEFTLKDTVFPML